MTFAGKILHGITGIMQVPVVVILILFIGAVLICAGWITSEYFNERRHMKVCLPELLDEIRKTEDMKNTIAQSGLLKSQKKALNEITEHPELTPVMKEALAAQLLEGEHEIYERKLKITDMLAKLGPMIGLLGTLIPLGPGIIALGQGDTLTLSQSLLTAFDTTVAGLLVAAAALIISGVRRGWYNGYMSVLETSMECVVEMEKMEYDKKEQKKREQI